MSKNDLSVLKLKKKYNLNSKTLDIYKSFKKTLKDLKVSKTLAIAVSGGPDSLALCVLGKIYEEDTKIKVNYVLVNHNLRNNSTQEALLVKALLKKKKIKLNIKINKKKINKNIQKNAREVRYNLLLNFCKTNKIKFLLTAHHREDQIETFLIRLSRGSGVQGLSSMNKITKLKHNIYLIRPLLKEKKMDLKFIAKSFFGKIFKDPSNNDKKYLRTKIRHLVKLFDKSGIAHERILKSISNLASTRDTLNTYINNFSKNFVKTKDKKKIIDMKKILEESDEVKLRVISNEIKVVSKKYYPPRSAKVINLIKNLRYNENLKSTLAGCLIIRKGQKLIISKEVSKKKKKT